MARRIEIELTSARPDGSWTWRAAGALKPRGSLDSSLLYSGAKVGDVVRAEAEFGIDGITVVAVEPPRAREDDENKDKIALLSRPGVPGVTTQLVGRGRPANGRPEERRRTGAARDRQADRGARGPKAARPGPGPEPPLDGRAGPPPGDGAASTSQAAAEAGAERAAKGATPQRGTSSPRAPRATQEAAQREPGDRQRAEREGASRAPRAPLAGRPQRQRRLNPASTHRDALLASLPPEHQPIAQQLLRGGIPAVRTALHFERERAREEGRPEPSTEGVLAIAESLVGKVKAAEWRDRAEAALAAGDDLTMRDLRALVSGSDVARDEASRQLAASLREMLERRVEAQREAWASEVSRYLGQGRVLRALRLSARPPDPAARLSAELAVRLRDAAGEALSPELGPERWLAILLAVSESPVRRTVKPKGLPPEPTPQLLEAARQQCGRVPALAPLLGLPVPPPPGPARPLGAARRPAALGPLQRPRRNPRPAPATTGEARGKTAPPPDQPTGGGPSQPEASARPPAPAGGAGDLPAPAGEAAPAASSGVGGRGDPPVHHEQPGSETLSLEEALDSPVPRERLGVDTASALGPAPVD